MNSSIIYYITIYWTCLIFHNACTSDTCESKNSCNECIVTSSICVWCATIKFDGTRCIPEQDNLENWCVIEDIIKSKSIIRQTVKNLNFSSTTGKVVQIRPQNMNIDLRPADLLEFEFYLKAAEDYPVDLYFLVDASDLMTGIKDKIVNESEQIYETMRNLTKIVRLGTGLFLDKNTLPVTDSINHTLTYSFRNRLSLTNKTEDFKQTVSEIKFGYNYDPPDGVLDALSQVITCEEIDWRNESTKMIIVLTDSPYHSSGDGRLSGIYRPYDGKCHTRNGVYENELIMDYPSVSIIKKLAAEADIKILFIVKHKNCYSSLSKFLKGSEPIVYDDNTNKKSLHEVLKSQYEEIKKDWKLRYNINANLRDHFTLSFEPNCTESTSTENPQCRMNKDKEIKIIGRLTLLDDIPVNNVSIDIVAEGIKETLNLNINIIKTCNCSVHENSPECNSAGTLICGVCECNADRYGNKCICDKNSEGVKPNDNSTCISPLSRDKICSGHGACDCGKCSCINKEDYTGEHCECYKSMCPLYNDLVCADHGQCACGKCKCNPGYSGDDCRCNMAKDNCMYGDKECNGRGRCECNSCQCDEPSGWDARRNGELCRLKCPEKSWQSHQCQLLEPIVLCYLNQAGCASHTDLNITGVAKVANQNRVNDCANATDNDWYDCPNVRTGLGCYTTFLYRYNNDSYGIKIIVQTGTHCAETYYIYGGICTFLLVIFGVIGLIIWKSVTSIRDRREYESFRNEVEAVKSSCENPLYKDSKSFYSNPGFRKRSDRRKSRN